MFENMLHKNTKKKSGKKPYRMGYILSGGAARGFAHAGVIKALEEKEIYPDVISGVSAGAIVGALYADGYTADEMFELVSKKRLFEFARIIVPRHGLLDISGLRDVMKELLHSQKIEDLKIPLYIAVTNFRTGTAEYLDKGELIPAIVASSSIPVLFKPTEINGQIYVDGGIIDNFPLEPIKDSCEQLLGIHVNPIGKEDVASGLLSIAIRTFHLSVAAEIDKKIPLLDYFFEPEDLKEFGIMDISKAKKMFDIGYHYAGEKLAKINLDRPGD